jgi:hypothetical protein
LAWYRGLTRRDGLLPVAIDIGQAFLEPPDVLGDVALDVAAGDAEPVLLGGEHLEAAHGFHHPEDGGERDEARGQCGQAVVIHW